MKQELNQTETEIDTDLGSESSHDCTENIENSPSNQENVSSVNSEQNTRSSHSMTAVPTNDKSISPTDDRGLP